MSYVDDLRETMLDQLDEAEECVRQAMRVAPDLIRVAVEVFINTRLGTVAPAIPDVLIDWLVEQLTTMVLAVLEQCLEYIDVLREMTQFLGSPDELRSAAAALDGIGDAVAHLKISADDLEGYMTWDDLPASRAYEVAISEQPDNLARVESAMTVFEDVLRTHADDIENYYVQLTLLCEGATAAIFGVVGAIFSLVAAVAASGPAAIAGVWGAVISFLITLGGVATAAISTMQILITSTQSTENKINAVDFTVIRWEGPRFAQIQ